MARWFTGFPTYLEQAARALNLEGPGIRARRNVTLAGIANLCAQLEHSEPRQASEILGHAAEHLAELRVATLAAELMLDESKRRFERGSLEDRGPTTGGRSRESCEEAWPVMVEQGGASRRPARQRKMSGLS